jgi:EAL domain-containing protein (putative c-di-GMP-specific phosphodiesterase class I)
MSDNRNLRWTSAEDVDDGSGILRSTRLITTNDIDMVFQPIVSIATGKLFALEALVRCKWPEFKNPVALLARAVQEKATGRLGRPIRDVAFERGAGYPLFVNIHPDELSERWLVRPDDPLNYHDSDVYLEITESAAFAYFDLCQSVLKELCSRALVNLVVDDLGAGHSNLKRILDLEPKVVKLDRELVRELDKNRRQQILVRSVVQLCKELDATVVAEGVETLDELKAVRDSGADYVQGYLLAKPAYPIPSFTWPL